MKIKTLENTPIATIVAGFNLGFSDYHFDMTRTAAKEIELIKKDGKDLSLSPAAFDKGKIIGFIHHGIDIIDGIKTAWNGGTAVAPNYRGQKITMQLYDFILPKLKAAEVQTTCLEVLKGNVPAIHVYKKIGFQITRTLDCYKSTKPIPLIEKQNLDIRILQTIDWSLIRSFQDWRPTWQNNEEKIKRSGEALQMMGLFFDNQLVGYCITDREKDSGLIYQYGIAKAFRRRGFGKYFFAYLQKEKEGPLKLINIDHGDESSKSFLEALDFDCFIQQYQMEMAL